MIYKLIRYILITSIVAFFFFSTMQPALAGDEKNHNDLCKQIVNRDYILNMAAGNGYLWQGTNVGLLQRSITYPDVFRLNHMLNSPMESNQVYAIAVGMDGTWFGTREGAAYLSNQGGWMLYNRENSPLAVNAVSALAIDESSGVWFGTWGGGACFLDSEGKWVVYNTVNSGLSGSNINAIVTDSSGGVWFAVDSRGVSYFSPEGEWAAYNMRNRQLPANDVLDIAIGEDGSVWFATYNGLASLQGGEKWEVYNTQNSSLPSDIVYSVAAAKEGSVWLGTAGGLVQISSSGKWSVYTAANSGLAGNIVRSVVVDEEGRVWAGTWGSGFSVYDPAKATWKRYSQGEYGLTSNSVSHILPVTTGEKEITWFSTEKGAMLYHAEGEKWVRYSVANGKLRDNQVNYIGAHEYWGTVFATDGGLAVEKDGYISFYHKDNSNLPVNSVLEVLFDEEGNMWLALKANGVACMSQDGSWRHYNTANSLLPADDVLALTLDTAGDTWMATWGGGAARLDQEESWHIYNTSNSKLPVNDVVSILADHRQGFWFGTWGGGLAYLDAAGNWTIYNRNNSPLPSNTILSLTLDSRNWLWIITADGIVIHDGEKMQLAELLKDCLPLGEISGAYADEAGNIWFTTKSNGAVIYNPDGLAAGLVELVDVTEKPDILVFYRGGFIVSDVPGQIEAGRTLVPMRAIFSALGAGLRWDNELKRVEATLQNKEIQLTIDEARAYMNGEVVELDVPARLVDGRTLVPLRFVAESLGVEVQWDEMLRAVILSDVQ